MMDKFILLVAEMRIWQNRYFKQGHAKYCLRQALKYERLVDEHIKKQNLVPQKKVEQQKIF